MEVIKNELELNEEEYDTLDDASIIVRKIANYLDDNTELVADGVSPYSYDEIKKVLYFLNEVVSCVMTFEGKEV